MVHPLLTFTDTVLLCEGLLLAKSRNGSSGSVLAEKSREPTGRGGEGGARWRGKGRSPGVRFRKGNTMTC